MFFYQVHFLYPVSEANRNVFVCLLYWLVFYIKYSFVTQATFEFNSFELNRFIQPVEPNQDNHFFLAISSLATIFFLFRLEMKKTPNMVKRCSIVRRI